MSASVASQRKTVAPHEDAPPAADTCASCQYAKPHAATDQFLFCRRHPPIPSVSNFHANFPIVSTGDWCGDFVALEEAAAVSPPVNVDVPYCSQAGETLSCTMGNWTNVPTSYAYQWMRDDAPIGDATDVALYEIGAEDAGHAVACIVTATNAAGSGVAPPSNAIAIGAVTPGTLTSGPFTDLEMEGLIGDISSNPTAWLGFDIDIDRAVITIRQQFPGVTTAFDICTRINLLLEPAATMTFPDTAAPFTFVITSASVGPTSIVSYASPPSYVVSEDAKGEARKATTDISATLLLREVLGAVSTPGSDAASGAEGATNSVARSARGASAARSARTRNNRHR